MANEGLPTEEEIARLPRWARVAFAARCARRAQPLFSKKWPNASAKHLEEIETAIVLAETASMRAAVCEYAVPGNSIGNPNANRVYEVNFRANASFYANVTAASGSSNLSHAINTADAAMGAGVEVTLIRADFELLLKLCRLQKWTDNTPVPPFVFPPLDENSEIIEKSNSVAMTLQELKADETILFKFRIYGKPGSTAQELAPHIRALYRALNQYTLAKYGKHVKLLDFKRLKLEYVGVPQS